MQNENNDGDHTSLSDVWRELLGGRETEVSPTSPEAPVPTLKSDPWSALLRAKDIETVDLQQVQMHLSDQDVEQALQIMQEQPIQSKNDTLDGHDLK
ncbi:MAG TPA: hypothetical protein VGU68_08760 [Ktedonobacteraceae bacterium]|nr:hypothetical protein [Ktedonobacteraceae bacterium]